MRTSRLGISVIVITASCVGFACSGTDNTATPSSTGGTSSAGGLSSTGGTVNVTGSSAVGGGAAVGGTQSAGGATSSGGTANSSGGTLNNTGGAATGGALANTGGTTATKAAGGTATTGGNGAGGAVAVGGTPSTGGTSSSAGGKATGGTLATGGSKTNGGASATGGSKAGTGGAPATGGVAATGGSKATTGGALATGGVGTGGSTSTGSVFSTCQFHFGTIDSIAKASNATTIAQLDFVTPGWMLGDWPTPTSISSGQGYVCTETAGGQLLAGKLPVDVVYVAANTAKSLGSLCDCNVSGCSGGDLCTHGSYYITQNWSTILKYLQDNSAGFSNCLGGRPIVFEMEPDWYQYTLTSQVNSSGGSAAWSFATAGTNMSALVAALKTNLPNAYFSMDISPWIGNYTTWYSAFNMSLFTFINTSGGGTAADSTLIRTGNSMTWAGVNVATGKPILADTGYGANGGGAGMDAAWNVAANINARIADGVISISQYNPCATGQTSCANANTWGPIISGIRSQLNAPRYCP